MSLTLSGVANGAYVIVELAACQSEAAAAAAATEATSAISLDILNRHVILYLSRLLSNYFPLLEAK